MGGRGRYIRGVKIGVTTSPTIRIGVTTAPATPWEGLVFVPSTIASSSISPMAMLLETTTVDESSVILTRLCQLLEILS